MDISDVQPQHLAFTSEGGGHAGHCAAAVRVHKLLHVRPGLRPDGQLNLVAKDGEITELEDAALAGE
eukprot:CAMPEP_0198217056 /NCGR_PEP_ID=MMETSP1445-20131203/61323_1 /TAXON_ID=36898 /ORGANISM="Pyramimonas sp., Strain CCMP2087" /LENGTH=66 /DNA_ID=CAMNT_0043893565 /DNA_START=372 /DNA_END=569 /DNA_ORIENTATION=+